MRLQTDTKAIVLSVLRDGPKHGYAIAKAVRETSAGMLKLGEGQLYPTLYSLEEEGWVVAEWEGEETDQPRRVYRITESGCKELEQRARRWHDFVAGVNRLMPDEPRPEVAR